MTRKLQTMVAIGAMAATLGLANAASAEDCVFSTPAAGKTGCSTTVNPTPLPGDDPTSNDPASNDPASGGDVEAAKAGDDTAPVSGSLPVTGAETLVIATLGAGLILAGGAMVLRTRSVAA